MKTKKFINATIYGHDDAHEVLIEDGKFKAFGNNLPDADEVYDLKGQLVLPPYVDSHLHLDYVFTGKTDGAKNDTGTLFEGIARWHDVKKHQTVEEAKERALRAIKEEMIHGVQYIRTHADVTDPKQTSLKALLELREELKDKVTIQIVSFPQEGMYAFKNGAELVEEGLKMGADCVGGIPHFEWSYDIGDKSVRTAVELAKKYNKMIDIHCDETDDVQSRHIQLLNALVMQEDMGHLTTASHICSLGSADNSYAFRLISLMAASGINVVAPATENAYLQGRQDSYPKRRGLTRVKELLEAGVNVAFAQDSIVDPWYPAGNGNLMNVLDNGIHLAQIMSFEDFEKNFNLITYNGAKALNIQDTYGLDEGKAANFIVLDNTSVFEAIRNRADVIMSVRDGEFLFKQQPKTYDVELKL